MYQFPREMGVGRVSQPVNGIDMRLACVDGHNVWWFRRREAASVDEANKRGSGR